jgi:hypothetical protein
MGPLRCSPAACAGLLGAAHHIPQMPFLPCTFGLLLERGKGRVHPPPISGMAIGHPGDTAGVIMLAYLRQDDQKHPLPVILDLVDLQGGCMYPCGRICGHSVIQEGTVQRREGHRVLALIIRGRCRLQVTQEDFSGLAYICHLPAHEHVEGLLMRGPFYRHHLPHWTKPAHPCLHPRGMLLIEAWLRLRQRPGATAQRREEMAQMIGHGGVRYLRPQPGEMQRYRFNVGYGWRVCLR